MTTRLNHRWRVTANGSAWRLEELVEGAWRPRYQARTPEALRQLIAAKCDRPLNEEAAIVIEEASMTGAVQKRGVSTLK